MATDRSTTVTPQDDSWIGQAATQDRRTIAKATLPALKLEPFNGDHTRWSEFAAGFKDLVHDVVDADYQRLQYLKMYLTPNVRSRISGLLSDPSTYQAALENLRNRYGNPLLIAQAATAKIARLPNIKVGDLRSLDQYIGGISDIITTLKRCNQVGEINSPTVVKMVLGKLPSVWKDTWGEEIIENLQHMSLDSLRGWLDRKLTGREMSGFIKMEDRLDSDARGRESPRRAYSNATSSASGACVICRGSTEAETAQPSEKAT